MTAALIIGMNGAAVSCTIAATSSTAPRDQDQSTVERNLETEDKPIELSPRLALVATGSSLTASHASSSLSGTGIIVGIISGGGSMVKAVKTVGVVGSGIGISHTPPSDFGSSAPGVEGGEDVSGNGTE